MSELIGACLIGQSGGPTAVINSSAYGVIKTALGKKCITKVLAAQHGIRGILDDDLIDMGKEDAETLELMLTTPASLIRSCRYKLKDFREDDTDYKRILEIFKNTISAISSITAATTVWIPATKFPNIWQLRITNAA